MDVEEVHALLRDAGGEVGEYGDTFFLNFDSGVVEVAIGRNKATLNCIQLSVELRRSDVAAQPAGGVYRGGSQRVMDIPPKMLLRRETAKDVKAKQMGLSREIQMADSTFDQAVYIVSDSADASIKKALESEAFRQSVLKCLEVGGLHVGVHDIPGRLHVHFTSDAIPEEPHVVRDVAELLLQARRQLPAFANVDKERGQGQGGCLATVALLSAVAGPVVAITAWFHYLPTGTDLAVGSALAGAVVYLLFVTASWVRARKTSAGISRIQAVVFGGFVGCLSLAVGSGLMLNCELDSDMSVHVVAVRNKWVKRDKRPTYKVRLAPWSPHREPFELSVRAEVYHQLKVGDAAHVRVGRGWLGQEWINDVFVGDVPTR